MKYKIFISFQIILLTSTIIFAQNKVVEPKLGFSFTIPEDWQGTKSERGYLLISKTQKGFMLITPHYFNSLEEIEENADKGVSTGSGTTLALEGKLSRIKNNGVAGTFKGILKGQLTIAYVISLLSPYGGGLSIFAFVDAHNYSDDYQDIAKTISNSVNFTEPQLENSIAESWKVTLNNCRLIHTNDPNSSIEGREGKIIIDLCEKGYFNYLDESDLSLNQENADENSAGNRVGTGEWKVIDRGDHAELQLLFNNGDVKDYLLTMDGENTFLNGELYYKYYRDSKNKDARPDCF